jgi:hypothetical protein
MLDILGIEDTTVQQNDQPVDEVPKDVNHDGFVTGADIQAKAGSFAAKKAWYKIQDMAYSPEAVAKAKKLGFTEAKGLYAGKPLLHGIHDGQGDFDMIKDRLLYAKGFDPMTADAIIAKIKAYRVANP